MSRSVEDSEAARRPLWDLMRERYPKESHALFPEVRNETGRRGDRAADAVAMCLWPSHGHEVQGFEFKASRGDWLRELKNPRKSNGVFPYCHRWWLVVTGTGIADVDELPSTWGMLMARKDGLRVVKQAPELQPQPMAPGFIASLLRSAQKQVEKEVDAQMAPINAAKYDARETIRAEFAERHRDDVARAAENERAKYAEIVEAVKKFEALSGIELWPKLAHQRWEIPNVAAAAKFLAEHARDQRLLGQLAELSKAAEDARRCLAEIHDHGGAR